MRRFLSYLTIFLKIASFIVLLVATGMSVHFFLNEYRAFRNLETSIMYYKNCWVSRKVVKASVLVAEDKLVKFKQDQAEMMDVQKFRLKAMNFLQSIEGEWLYTVLERRNEEDVDKGTQFKARIEANTMTVYVENGDSLMYNLTLLDYYRNAIRYQVESYDPHSESSFDLGILGKGENVNELIIMGSYMMQQEENEAAVEEQSQEDDSESDGPEDGDAPYGEIVRLTRIFKNR